MSQTQSDGEEKYSGIYAIRALSVTERRYAVTELETLAVVWAMSHFHLVLDSTPEILYTVVLSSNHFKGTY